jgi:hypothetical protein
MPRGPAASQARASKNAERGSCQQEWLFSAVLLSVGTNLTDASETVQAVAEDVVSGRLGKGVGVPSAASALAQLLKDRSCQVAKSLIRLCSWNTCKISFGSGVFKDFAQSMAFDA